MHGVEIGRRAVVRRAILDKNVYVGESVEIGVDREKNQERFHRSAGGIVVIPRASGSRHEGRADDARDTAQGTRSARRPLADYATGGRSRSALSDAITWACGPSPGQRHGPVGLNPRGTRSACDAL
jgi:hypothetical protein